MPMCFTSYYSGYQGLFVELDVRDLGNHVDSIQPQRVSTLANSVVIVLSRIMAMCVLPMDFHGKLRILRTMFMHACCVAGC